MATMASTGGERVQSSREARRRRILERGSDRLALVTGRIESLPSDAGQSSPAAPPMDQAPATGSVQHEDRATGSSLPESEMSRRGVSNETVEPLLHHHDTGGSMSSRAESLLGIEKEASQVSSRASGGVKKELSPVSSFIQGEAADRPREKLGHRKSFTTSQICFAITVAENDRMCCSIAAAFLVILSHIGLPIPGWHILKGMILFKPLYLLFLTNASIVFRRLILVKPGAQSKMGQMSTSPTSGGDGLAQLGKALEIGLLLQNIFVALFMDFGIYTVVLVCGLSLIQSFIG